MQIIKSLRLLIDWRTGVATALAVLSTYLCRRAGLVADFPLTLIGTAVVFPLVFSIGGAYKRREAALDDYGSIKAHGRAIYFAARDWVPETDETLLDEAKDHLGRLFHACRTLFQTPVSSMHDAEADVYRRFSDLSAFIKGFRERGLPSGEASRCNQYLSKMLFAFESVKHVYQYRTPRTLKAYSRVFIFLLPVVYGPYFAHLALEFSRGLEYVMPILFAVVLMSLENIQEHLENPFDQIGEDDIHINVDKFVARLAA